MRDTRTRAMVREQIAQIVGNNPRAIKLLESLADDVANTLPSNIDEAQASAMFSLHGADGSKQNSARALRISLELQALQQACIRASSDATSARREIEMLRTEVHELRARLASAVSIIQRSADAALALTIGV